MAGIERIIEGRARDLGGFEVRRVLPAGGRQMVGPFIFFDHIGPATFEAGHGIDVRPHPHIGLATVTYLFDGELVHRDSLGYAQPIRPGDVNWMTAGRGIVHSERTDAAVRARPASIHGIQSWVALPLESELVEPEFVHHPEVTLPTLSLSGCKLRIVAGNAFGARAPVVTCSETLYVDVDMPSGATLTIPPEHAERAVYAASGAVLIAGTALEPGVMAVLDPGIDVPMQAVRAARVMLLGGAPLESPRYIWWNFVSSSRERIEQAKRDWAAQRFAPVPGETEFTPLPE
jgi:redox-sensitive bicupin YhaK (pirin superfamily)